MCFECDDRHESDDCNFDPDVEQHSVHNSSFLHSMNGTYKNIKDQFIQNKFEFNNCPNQLLYNEDQLDEKTRVVYPQEVFDSIDEYLMENTSPNANKYLNRKMRNEQTGNKEDHCYHYSDDLYKELYFDWIDSNRIFIQDISILYLARLYLIEEGENIIHIFINDRRMTGQIVKHISILKSRYLSYVWH